VIWLVASAERTDVAAVQAGAPALWRELRRFNPPVQLAVAAAHDVVPAARVPAEAALIALAPCQSGSPELHRWVREIDAAGAARMNPTHTLHAVDNLALSVLAIALANHAWGLSLGGAAGQLWVALELALERLRGGDEPEAILFAGDQDAGATRSPAAGAALLFAREAAPYAPLDRPVRLVGIERVRAPAAARPHAAAPAQGLLAALRQRPPGRFAYPVPAAHGDGVDAITVVWEVG
jgi:hypothetical protein